MAILLLLLLLLLLLPLWWWWLKVLPRLASVTDGDKPPKLAFVLHLLFGAPKLQSTWLVGLHFDRNTVRNQMREKGRVNGRAKDRANGW